MWWSGSDWRLYKMIAIVFLRERRGLLTFGEERCPAIVGSYGITTTEWEDFVRKAHTVLQDSRYLSGTGVASTMVVSSVLLVMAFALVVVSRVTPFFLMIPLTSLVLAIVLVTTIFTAVQRRLVLRIQRGISENVPGQDRGLRAHFVQHQGRHQASIQIFAHTSGAMVLAGSPGSVVIPNKRPGEKAIWKVSFELSPDISDLVHVQSSVDGGGDNLHLIERGEFFGFGANGPGTGLTNTVRVVN